ncbi:MAG: hypothetical protein RIF33_00175 [Cyclobacteriaceae bacterium]
MRYTIIIFAILTNVSVCMGQLKWQPYYFDCGPADSELQEGAQRLSPEDEYKADKGLGWIDPTGNGFVNEDFKRSRDAFNIDGIAAPSLDLRVDLPTGKWWVTLMMDAGYEDSSTVSLKINEELIDLSWHAFQPSAEPRKELQPSYRVYQGAFDVNESLLISIMGGDNEARLLGLSLIPHQEPTGTAQQGFATEIQSLGKYSSEVAVAPILERLQILSASNPRDPYYAYWSNQLDLLARAEDHFMKRGWEKYIQTTGLSIWGQLHQAVMILDGMLNHPQAADSPLYERTLFLRGRILYWLGLERGGPNEIAQGRKDLAKLYEMYPEDNLLAMYNGKPVDIPDACDELAVDANAPRWSSKQLELLCRMRNIAHWWVLEQQAENGEFGGKLGDDVELLRWWTPVLLSGDSLSFVGWSKLADEIFQNRKVYKGYSKKPLDVEHASEFIADTAPMMAVCSDDQVYLDRLRYSVDYFMDLWTGKSDKGNRFFKSSWFSSTEVDENPPRNRDHGYNARATKAVRYYAWKTQDAQVIEALNEWSEAWLSAAMRTDKGKPEGVIPASIRYPDEAFNGDELTWYKANMYWDYFEWEQSPGSMILDQLLYSYTSTRDERFLEPLLKSLELIEKYEKGSVDAEEGSEAWAAEILKSKSSFWSVAAQWRFLTGSTRFDDLLEKYGTPYLRYRLTGDEAHLEEGLEKVLENARYNTPLKTFEAVHTDRVYIRGYEHLTTMLTGNGSNEGLSPLFAVTWENTDDNFTALVKESSFNHLSVEFYSHADNANEIDIRLWQLEPGEYQIISNDKGGTATPLTIVSKGQRLKLNVPPNELISLEIKG